MNVQCPSCETIYRIDPARVPEGGVRARCAVCSFAIELAAPEAEVVHQPPAIEAAPLAAPEPDVVAHISPDGAAVAEPPVERDETPAPVAEAADQPVMIEPEAEAASTDESVEEVDPVRLSRPFVAQEAVEEAPSAEGRPVTRPTAPVFKPTPDAPVQHAQVPPAVPTTAEPEVVAEPEPEPVPEEVVPTLVQPAVEAPQPTEPAAPAKPVNPFLQRDPKQKARRLARALISDMIVYQPQKRQETLENGTLKEAFEEEIKKSWEEYVDQVGKEMADSSTFFKEALNEILAGGQELF